MFIGVFVASISVVSEMEYIPILADVTMRIGRPVDRGLPDRVDLSDRGFDGQHTRRALQLALSRREMLLWAFDASPQ